jgi:serine/threonine-protein kinase HipA
VKSWGRNYPFLAANEYFCMSGAKLAGLHTPEFFLSDNGGLFVLSRFDIKDDGSTMGFEDMCSLQALGTARKYTGSYERVAKTIKKFISGPRLMAAREQFFSTLVLPVILLTVFIVPE